MTHVSKCQCNIIHSVLHNLERERERDVCVYIDRERDMFAGIYIEKDIDFCYPFLPLHYF